MAMTFAPIRRARGRDTRPMIALDETASVNYRNARTGRPELGEAKSADGQWAFLHEESTGTPWIVVHLATGRDTLRSNLDTARRDAADGQLLAELDQIDADRARR